MQKRKIKKLSGNIIIYTLLLSTLVITIFPLLYTFLGSFKSNMELLVGGNSIIPSKFVMENYQQAWELANFKQYTFNSLFLSFFIVVGTIFTSTIAAYVFERGEFKLKNVILNVCFFG